MIAAAVGTAINLDEPTSVDLGFGCLRHFIGIFTVDRLKFEAQKVLDADDFTTVAVHPFRKIELHARNMHLVPIAAQLVIFRLHECADGSGYQCGRTLAETRPHARRVTV